MRGIIYALLRGKMNWRARFLWAMIVAIAIPAVTVIWVFSFALILRADEVIRVFLLSCQ